ncbi:hypothetical protein ABPG72_007966 [Tetrahymena utriculariae]
MFGEFEFFSNTVLPYFVKTCQKFFVVKISSKKFQEVVKYNNNDYEKFMELNQFNNQINLINTVCLICRGKDHSFLNCYQSHLFTSNSFIIPKYNFSAIQERKFYDRSKKNLKVILLSIFHIQLDSNIEEEEQQSQSSVSPVKKDDETSIFKFPSQNSCKYKASQEEANSKSEQSCSTDSKLENQNDSYQEVNIQSNEKFDQPQKNEKQQSYCFEDKHSNNNKSIQEIDIDRLKNLQDPQIKNDQMSNSIVKANSLLPKKSSIQQMKHAVSMNRNQESINQNNLIEEYLHTKQWNGSATYWNFDKLHNFIYYFPQYNFNNFIKNLKNPEKEG